MARPQTGPTTTRADRSDRARRASPTPGGRALFDFSRRPAYALIHRSFRGGGDQLRGSVTLQTPPQFFIRKKARVRLSPFGLVDGCAIDLHGFDPVLQERAAEKGTLPPLVGAEELIRLSGSNPSLAEPCLAKFFDGSAGRCLGGSESDNLLAMRLLDRPFDGPKFVDFEDAQRDLRWLEPAEVVGQRTHCPSPWVERASRATGSCSVSQVSLAPSNRSRPHGSLMITKLRPSAVCQAASAR
jgi:hypothetical protein